MITSETGCEFSIILSHLKLKPKAVSRHVEREIHYHCWQRNQIYVCAWRHLDHTEADCSSRPADSGLAPTTENQPLLHRRVYDLGGALANNNVLPLLLLLKLEFVPFCATPPESAPAGSTCWPALAESVQREPDRRTIDTLGPLCTRKLSRNKQW